jgi:hypothetical protein
MKQMCSYCGQDTYNVDIEYLVGINHLSCMLSAEQKAEGMQIVNWKKLNSERISICGADMYFTNFSENAKEYKCELHDAILMKLVFWVKLKKMPNGFDLEIEYAETQTGSKVKRVVRTNEIKTPTMFMSVIHNAVKGHSVYEALCRLLGEIQNDKYRKTKLQPVSGITNFNMPVSNSIKW